MDYDRFYASLRISKAISLVVPMDSLLDCFIRLFSKDLYSECWITIKSLFSNTELYFQ